MRKALLLIPVGLLMIGASPASRPSIDVQVASLFEVRGTGDVKNPLTNSAFPLSIKLSLNGDIGNVRGIPVVHILECRDDLGDVLRDETTPLAIPALVDGKLQLAVAVSPPPRRAQTISLKGADRSLHRG